MTDHTEAEAREVLLGEYGYHESDCEMGPSAGVFCTCTYPTAVRAYAEAVRATEREKVRTLVESLVSKARCGCGLASIDYGEAVPHVEDCPWVEARLWLDGGAE